MELRNPEVLEQISAYERLPQLANPRKAIATKDSVEFGDSFDEEIDAVGGRGRPFTLGLYRGELGYWGRKMPGIIGMFFNGICSTILTKVGRRKSRIRNDGTGGIPAEKTWREEVQIQSSTCPLSRKHPLLHYKEIRQMNLKSRT